MYTHHPRHHGLRSASNSFKPRRRWSALAHTPCTPSAHLHPLQVLSDEALSKQYYKECTQMADRILKVCTPTMAIPTVSRYVYLLWLYLLWLHSLWLLPLPWRCAHPGTVAPPTYYGRVLTPRKMRSLLREAIEAQGSEHNWRRITDPNPKP